MKLDSVTMMLILLAGIVVLGMWQSRKMKTKVFCNYTSRSKQTYDKLVNEKDGKVIFEGKAFKLLPAYGKSKYYDKGLSSLFPTKITAYDFRWNSDLPIDPNTGEPAMLTPEVMNKLNQEGAMLSYTGSNQTALATSKSKFGGMDKFMPIIMIALACAVAFLIYTNFQSSKNDKTTQQAIIDIYNTFNKIGQPVIPAK